MKRVAPRLKDAASVAASLIGRRWLIFLPSLLLPFAMAICPAAAAAERDLPVHYGAAVFIVQTPKMPSEQIRRSAQRVMLQHDYRSVRRRVLQNLPDHTDADKGFLQHSLRTIGRAVGDFFEWIFSGLFSSRRGGAARPPAPASQPSSTSGSSGLDFSFGEALLYIGLAILIGTVIWLIATVLKRSDGSRSLDREGLFGEEHLSDLSVPPGELAASTYESRALQMAHVQDFRGAIRELLIGSMSWIERAGLIRFRKGLTNRDYVRAVWRQEDRRVAYSATALEFERIYFGRREATREMFQDCLQSFQGSFREEETTTAKV
jgi:hypothetical protein